MRDDEVAPGSQGEDGSLVCTACGTTIDPTAWHPVATAPDGSGDVYLFCDERCRTEWLNERT